MKFRNLLLVLFTVICAATSAFGCLCFGPDSPKKALKWSDVVFTGEIVAEENDEQKETIVLYKFKVEKAWKGVSENQLIVVDANARTSCQSGLKVGQRYVIFASYKDIFRDEVEPRYIYFDKHGKPQPVIDICSWSANLENPKVEKKILNKLGKAKLINK